MIEIAMELLRQEEFKRPGANRSQINQIRRMHAGGVSAEKISDNLNIRLSAIKSYLDIPPSEAVVQVTVADAPKKSARRP